MRARKPLVDLLPRIGGVFMLGVFSVNSYIGLKDVELAQLQPLHLGGNLIMAIIDLVAASILLSYGIGKRFWILLAGAVWPAVYVISLFADVESRMCLFTGTNCFSSVEASYQYLILGQLTEGWLLWPYTILTAICLLLSTVLLSLLYAFLR
jgi:hypothetical protein